MPQGNALSPTIGCRVRQRRMDPQATSPIAKRRAANTAIDLAVEGELQVKRAPVGISTDKSTAACKVDEAQHETGLPLQTEQQPGIKCMRSNKAAQQHQLLEHGTSSQSGSRSSMQAGTSISNGTTLAEPTASAAMTPLAVEVEQAVTEGAGAMSLEGATVQSLALAEADAEAAAATRTADGGSESDKETLQSEQQQQGGHQVQNSDQQQLPAPVPAEDSNHADAGLTHCGTAAEAAKARAAATAAVREALKPKVMPKANPIYGPTAADMTAAARVAAAAAAGARDAYGDCLQRFGERLRHHTTVSEPPAQAAPADAVANAATDSTQVPDSVQPPQQLKKKRKRAAKSIAAYQPIVPVQQQVTNDHPLLLACMGEAQPLTALGARMTPTMAACFQAMLQQRMALLHRPPLPANCKEQLQQLITSHIKTGYVMQARDELQELLVQHAQALLQREDITSADVMNNLPADLHCGQWLEVYTVDGDDPHPELHGNKGAKAKCDIPCGQFLGLFAGHMMCNVEREDPVSGFEQRPPACVLHDMHQYLTDLPPQQQVDFSQVPMIRSGIAQLHYIDQALCQQLLTALEQAASSERALQSNSCHSDNDQAGCLQAATLSADPAEPDSSPCHKKSRTEDQAIASGTQSGSHTDQVEQAPHSGPAGCDKSWAVSAGKACQVIWDMMCSQLAQLQDKLSQPLDMQLLQCKKAVLQACLLAHQASWAAMCDAYGMDVSFKIPPWMKAPALPTEVESAHVARLTQGLEWLNHINSITFSATAAHRNSTAYVNDPALHTPSSYLEPVCTGYAHSQPNCIVAEICVAGWPFPCFVATTPITQGSPICFSYGVHFWVGRAKRLKALEDAVAHLEMALRCHRLEQQVENFEKQGEQVLQQLQQCQAVAA